MKDRIKHPKTLFTHQNAKRRVIGKSPPKIIEYGPFKTEEEAEEAKRIAQQILPPGAKITIVACHDSARVKS